MADSLKFKTSLNSWVLKALRSEGVDGFQVEISGTSEKSDGYLGDIVFVKVPAKLKNGKEKIFHLVFKLGKNNEHLRNMMPITEVYGREIYMYKIIFPHFEKFQKEKIGEGIGYLPKCYATFDEYGMEVLIFENLKCLGYELHNQRQTMNLQHLKFVLKNYGKWHALSFALRDQRNEEFEKLTSHMTDIMKEFIKNESTAKTFEDSLLMVKDMLKENNEFQLLNKFNEATKYGGKRHLNELIMAKEDQVVLTHGDCWNNNFMFRYGECEKTVPKKMAIIDWQVSSVKSPVFDLSYFLYIVTSGKELEHFKDLMMVYHTSLSENLKRLGSSSEKLFSFSSLMDHWRKYSLYGILLAPMILQFVLCDSEDAPSLGDVTGEQNFQDVLKSIEIKDKKQYYDRIKAAVEHYIHFQTNAL